MSAFVLVLLSMSMFGTRLVITASNSTIHHVYLGESIQEAINSAQSGDMIFVHNGTYYENLVVDKMVSLIGENKAVTVIDGYGAGIVVSLIERANVNGFTIRNGEYGIQVRRYAISPVYTGHTIDGNNIIDNRYGGIYLRGVGGNAITNNFITNNSLFGIHLYHAGNNTLSNNTIVNNGHGIDFYGNSNDNILRNNNMTNNEYNFGLILRGETRNWLFGAPSKPGIVNDVDASNTVDGKRIYYWVNRSDAQVPTDAGYVWLNNCNNITIDGSSLTNNLQGILLLFAKNTLINNNNITSNVYGICVGVFSKNNTIAGNTLKDNLNGIYLGDLSRFTTMRNNNISGSQMNFGVDPDIPRFMDRSDLINDVDTSNTVDGKPIVYWINQHYRQVPTNAGYVMLISSTNILIEGLNLSNNVQSVFVIASNNTVIANNSITNSIYGIDIKGYRDFPTGVRHISFNSTIRGNVLINNGVGMRAHSDNSTFSKNTVFRNPLGICLMGTSYSTVSRNVVVSSDINQTYPSPEVYIFYYPEWPWERSRELMQLEIGGIIVGGAYNVVYGNTVMDSFVGISMYDQIRNHMGTRNVIFHNNLINNTRFQAIENPKRPTNYWDNGYPSGGNYWSDYEDRYPDANELNGSGIWDTPYVIFGNNQDNYPLMNPWTPTPPTVIATADVVPNTLNLKSKGKWITCYIELAEGYSVSDIDVSTVMLNDTIPISLLDVPAPKPVPTEIGDYDIDGIPDLIVKFSRTMVSELILSKGITHGSVTLTITGEVDGTPFEGSDSIKLVFPSIRCRGRKK